MPPKKKPTNELFFLAFGGEVVSITTTIKASETLQIEDETIQVDIPNTFEGYLLDMDEEYYYLGDTSNEVSRAVRKEYAVVIEVAKIQKTKTRFDAILDEMEEPDEKDYN
jgi:hypothetical protein